MARNRLARLNADGTLDVAFNPDVNSRVHTMTLQADGKVIVGGFFSQVNGVPRGSVARIQADGTLDVGYDPNVAGLAYAVAGQEDGDVLVGGFFGSVGGFGRNGIARLDNEVAIHVLAVPDTSRVVWRRGGSSPEAQDVAFDLSTDGGTTWMPLGLASPSASGWQKAGLNLPASAQIRARARTVGSYSSGSSSVIEAVTSYSADPPIMEPLITNVSRQDNSLTIDFTAPPSLIRRVVRGSFDLDDFSFDLTPQTDFSEVSPGHYRVTVTVVGSPTRAFFRIGR